MSDLQCAATLLLVPSGLARELGTALAGARIAHVWTSPAPAAVAAADAIAGDLGVGVTRRSDLEEGARRDPALTEIADLHRGETVVVVVDTGDAVVEVAIDSDGSTRRTWGRSVG